MKKLFLVLLILPLLLWQCNPGPSRTELRQANDSLLMVSAQKEIQLNQFIETMGDIEENLRLIKEKEQILSVDGPGSDQRGRSGEEINQDIQLIYDLMVQNKNRIQELEKQMKTAGVDNSRLNRLIAGLNQQLQEKSEEIMKLQNQLEQRDVHISHLSGELFDLSFEIDSLRKVQEATRSQLDNTTDAYNTAWFAMGTRRELRDKNIITRDGFLFFSSDQVLKENFDHQYFKQLDIRQQEEFQLFSDKAELLTAHPADSFELVEDEDGMLLLVITDPAHFWSISRYLVVRVD